MSYRRHGPPAASDVFWIVEVADTTLRFDRDVKLPLYAAAGIPEVWIVDLTTDTIEIHRVPRAGGYGQIARVADGSVSPGAFPRVGLAVIDILPPSS